MRTILEEFGAVFRDDSERIAHFGDARAELAAALGSVALVERSALGRLVGTGPDLLDLLERLSTGEVARLLPGEGRPTVVTTAKGRIVERLFVHHLGAAGVLLVGGAGRSTAVLQHLRRYTFAEQTDLVDMTPTTAQLAISGPRASHALRELALDPPAAHGASHGSLESVPIVVLGQDGLAADGFSLVFAAEAMESLWPVIAGAVVRAGGRPIGEDASEAARILRGIPASGFELTEEYNPLEAGLWDAVSFSKGCYVGQEVVARLRTYDKISRARIGIALPPGHPLPEPGRGLTYEGRVAGAVTSAVLVPGESAPIGLAYIKKREAEGEGPLLLTGSETPVRRVNLPFPSPFSTDPA